MEPAHTRRTEASVRQSESSSPSFLPDLVYLDLGQNLKQAPERAALRDGESAAGLPSDPADSHSNQKPGLLT
ncbi:MAG TPA: hypothetical protein VEM93_02575 [Actinomycetota bacterium]|nr:hypothetical protein [Actinomycetota bacterium]